MAFSGQMKINMQKAYNIYKIKPWPGDKRPGLQIPDSLGFAFGS
jgi:hypothetical protein